MGNQFNPGDLALIVGTSGGWPETVGMCVQLTRPVNLHSGPGWHWRGCPARGTNERYLMPLRGDFEPDQQEQREAEPCA